MSSLGLETEHAAELAAANEDDLSSLRREHVIKRLSLLKSMLLPPDIILRSSGAAASKQEPNEFWPLLDPQNSVGSLCDFLTGIGARERVCLCLPVS